MDENPVYSLEFGEPEPDEHLKGVKRPKIKDGLWELKLCNGTIEVLVRDNEIVGLLAGHLLGGIGIFYNDQGLKCRRILLEAQARSILAQSACGSIAGDFRQSNIWRHRIKNGSDVTYLGREEQSNRDFESLVKAHA